MSDLLPNGKQHVSFSEVRNWIECGWRHYLQQIKKINLDKDSEHLDFGTAVHASCENFLKTRTMDVDISLMMIVSAWEKKKFPDVEKWAQWASDSLGEVPNFLETNFPGWETISAEEPLYENVENHNAYFKGFVDSVIKVPKPNGSFARNKETPMHARIKLMRIISTPTIETEGMLPSSALRAVLM